MAQSYKDSFYKGEEAELWQAYMSGDMDYTDENNENEMEGFSVEGEGVADSTAFRERTSDYEASESIREQLGNLGRYPIEEDVYIHGIKVDYSDDVQEISRRFNMFLHGKTQKERDIGALLVYVQVRKVIWSVGMGYFKYFMTSENAQYRNDLFMQGYVAILEQASKYDPTVSMPNTFFFPYIKHAMSEYVSSHIKRSTPYNANKLKKLRLAEEKLLECGKTNITYMDLAYETGMKPAEIRKLMSRQALSDAVSLDAVLSPSDSNSNTPFNLYNSYNVPEADEDYSDPFKLIAKKSETEAVHLAIDELDEQENIIICALFGIGRESRNYTEIALETGLTTDRIKTIETQAKNHLRSNPRLRNNYKGGRAMRIQRELDFEPVVITPVSAGKNMMDVIEEIEFLDM